MNNKMRWTFRILLILTLVYHIWSFINFKFQAFQIIKIDGLAFTLIASAMNYLIQIGLPLLFLYLSFEWKKTEEKENTKISVKEEKRYYPNSALN